MQEMTRRGGADGEGATHLACPATGQDGSPVVGEQLPRAWLGQTWFAEVDIDGDAVLLPGTRLPAGVRLGRECRALFGTPAECGTFRVEFEQHPGGRVRCLSFEVVEPEPLAIARTRLPPMRRGEPVDIAFALTAPEDGVAWYVTHGRLPPGLRLDARCGVLYGTPSQPGVWCCAVGAAKGERRALAPVCFVVAPASPEEAPSLLHRLRAERAAARTWLTAEQGVGP